ncbi:hypothetical protein [Massilia sp. DWR3-1-1]|uniref:hypothetical protein n=1 Tax=Massilia sp. DWR3-1-1 TaxID=2804559 RepID=UPI003CEBFD4B
MMKLNLTLVPAALLAAALLASSACASGAPAGPQGSTHLSNASAWVANGSATVVTGSLMTLAGVGGLVLASVEVAGDASVVVLTGAADGIGASVRLSGQGARNAALVAGASVEVVARASGYLLIASGQVIAFIPNALGRALLHDAPLAGPA